MRMPRIRLRTLMIGVGVLAVVFAVMPVAWILFPTFRTHAGGGGKTLPLIVSVIDDANGKPIAGARVIVRNAFRPDVLPPDTDRTSTDGRAGMTIVAKSWGQVITAEAETLYHVPIWRTEQLSTAGGSVAVLAGGYEPTEVLLPKTPPRGEWTVRLRRKP